MQGWYWPYLGPANTLYVPGPLLKACNNEILLLEVGTQKPSDAAATGERSHCACRLSALSLEEPGVTAELFLPHGAFRGHGRGSVLQCC